MKTIPLTQGKVAFVDDEDFERVNQFKWYAFKSRRTWYAQRGIIKNGKCKMVRLHSFLLPGPSRADHKDGNGLNNQQDNLRPATRKQNAANQKKQKGCTSKYKGVHWYKRIKCWAAGIQVNKKHICLGYFDDEKEAALAYDAAATKYFEGYARLNFP